MVSIVKYFIALLIFYFKIIYLTNSLIGCFSNKSNTVIKWFTFIFIEHFIKKYLKVHGIIKLKWYMIIIMICKLISWKEHIYTFQLDPYKNSMILKQLSRNWSQKVYLSLTLTDFLGTLRYNIYLSKTSLYTKN